MTVHLVNLTNPMFHRGAIRAAVPVGPLEVEVALPAGVTPRGAKLLVGETADAARGARRPRKGRPSRPSSTTRSSPSTWSEAQRS